ncbi:MAG: hypothetical protein O3B13_03025 [Planctomycetota bacterium]|nr:hypothetical protein [Planctomycetota bacterium]
MSLGMRVHVFCGVMAVSREVQAGMPSIRLTDLARLRLDGISFFLMVLLACACGVQLLWNSLRSDFPKLPWLSFRRSVSLVVLWGMLAVIVLTMISGARELMTPGAWQRDGFTHSLKGRPDQESSIEFTKTLHVERRQKLTELWRELMHFAVQNDGRFPSKRDSEVIEARYWNVLEVPDFQFVYIEGRTAEKDALLAYEPDCFIDGQLGLLTSGEIRFVHQPEILEAREVGGSGEESP